MTKTEQGWASLIEGCVGISPLYAVCTTQVAGLPALMLFTACGTMGQVPRHHVTEGLLSCGLRRQDVLRITMTELGEQLASLKRDVQAFMFISVQTEKLDIMTRALSRRLRTQQVRLGRASQAAMMIENAAHAMKFRGTTSTDMATIKMADAMTMSPKKAMRFLQMAEDLRSR